MVLRNVIDFVVGLLPQEKSCLVLASLGDLLLPDSFQNISVFFSGRSSCSTL